MAAGIDADYWQEQDQGHISKQEEKGKMTGKHICLKIYEDGSHEVTDANGDPLDPMKKPKPLEGDPFSYPPALWFTSSPPCVWVGGRQY